MPNYTVEFPVIHKGKKYMPEDPISMSEKLAEPLLKKKALSRIAPQEITEEAIVAAIYKLDPDDKKHWTPTGLPLIPALEALLGGKVSTKARGAALERYQKETA